MEGKIGEKLSNFEKQRGVTHHCYSKCHGMRNAKLGDVPSPEWFEVIRQADLSTSVKHIQDRETHCACLH